MELDLRPHFYARLAVEQIKSHLSGGSGAICLFFLTIFPYTYVHTPRTHTSACVLVN